MPWCPWNAPVEILKRSHRVPNQGENPLVSFPFQKWSIQARIACSEWNLHSSSNLLKHHLRHLRSERSCVAVYKVLTVMLFWNICKPITPRCCLIIEECSPALLMVKVQMHPATIYSLNLIMNLLFTPPRATFKSTTISSICKVILITTSPLIMTTRERGDGLRSDRPFKGSQNTCLALMACTCCSLFVFNLVHTCGKDNTLFPLPVTCTR